MHIFRKTLKDEFLFTLVFSLAISVILFLVIQEFAIARHLDFSGFIGKVPDVLKPIAEKFLVLNIFGGYLHIVASVYWIIFTAFYTCMTFSGLVSREVERKTIPLLLSHPVSRLRVIGEKYAASVIFLVVVVFFAYVGFYTGTFHGYVDVPYSARMLIVATSSGLAFFLALSSISLFFSVVFNEYKKAAVVSLLFFLLSYLAFFLGAFSPRWAQVKQFTLFRFFDTEKLFMMTEFQTGNIISLLVISIVFVILTVLLFNRKDIPH
jgi:ABC-2 type transport system permease protein